MREEKARKIKDGEMKCVGGLKVAKGSFDYEKMIKLCYGV